MVQVTLLGTAALMPTPERGTTAAALVCQGRTLLLDCGEGTQTAARRWHVNLMSADVIALTHYHGDHIFGLPGLLQTMGTLGRTAPLTLTGPGEIQRELAPVMQLVNWVPYPVKLMSMPGGGLRLCELHPSWPAEALLTTFPTEHRVPSQGYRFDLGRPGRFLPEAAEKLGLPRPLWRRLQHGEQVEWEGRLIQPEEVLGPRRRGLSVVFSGDTVPCRALTDRARGADLFICEGTYGDSALAETARANGHMTFAEAGRTARDAEVRRLWLTHFSQMMEDPADFLPNAAALYPGAVIGEDGMSIELAFDEE
ncbi:MAG: ribonuclease Z [Clostridia bacterium]|nr:ribonuclease Z [Clostridia bacterium]